MEFVGDFYEEPLADDTDDEGVYFDDAEIMESIFVPEGASALWLCGSVALWLCGSVALWLCGTTVPVPVPRHTAWQSLLVCVGALVDPVSRHTVWQSLLVCVGALVDSV